jgi:hypothetical protein
MDSHEFAALAQYWEQQDRLSLAQLEQDAWASLCGRYIDYIETNEGTTTACINFVEDTVDIICNEVLD